MAGPNTPSAGTPIARWRRRTSGPRDLAALAVAASAESAPTGTAAGTPASRAQARRLARKGLLGVGLNGISCDAYEVS